MNFVHRLLCAAALISTLTLALVAQTPSDPLVYIHAGTLLDRPGQTPRGPSTVLVRGGQIEAVLRDGFVAAGSGISGPGGHGDSANNANRDIAGLRRSHASHLCNGADEPSRPVHSTM